MCQSKCNKNVIRKASAEIYTNMDNKLILHLKIGIIKDLFAKGLITQKQMEQAVSLLLKKKHMDTS
jgi:hypothetical protein